MHPARRPMAMHLIFAAAAAPLAGQLAYAAEPLLLPLTPTILKDANLEGELGCSFSTDDDDVLLLAFGNVASEDPSDATAQTSAGPHRIAAPGGFDAMLDGARFAGDGLEIDVAVIGEAVSGGESPAMPARLSASRNGGSAATYEGFWTCGPSSGARLGESASPPCFAVSAGAGRLSGSSFAPRNGGATASKSPATWVLPHPYGGGGPPKAVEGAPIGKHSRQILKYSRARPRKTKTARARRAVKSIGCGGRI